MKRQIFLIMMMAVIYAWGCKNSNTKQEVVVPQKKHWVEITGKNKMIYVDSFPTNQLLQNDSSNVNAVTKFCCYKVEFIDNNAQAVSNGKKEEDSKYFLYDMYKDWKIVNNGDSIAPIHFQPLTKMSTEKNEGILVFEVNKDLNPDTLFFNDKNGVWGSHIIALGR
ncbi:hypothetical protein [Pinibacter aurantiacus]|uniref:Uncharacterized protein n=1 Tax=Pinibacter aurantiacus TaxID=2851599 RepID=A0A9E2W3T3_9BACT|nr:hypothetical protein [Pinibacter aurantiacus]MBV4358905.1 hypothetical protein [Pinibacter aurantiacus]